MVATGDSEARTFGCVEKLAGRDLAVQAVDGFGVRATELEEVEVEEEAVVAEESKIDSNTNTVDWYQPSQKKNREKIG